jgi:hypothetical protein
VETPHFIFMGEALCSDIILPNCIAWTLVSVVGRAAFKLLLANFDSSTRLNKHNHEIDSEMPPSQDDKKRQAAREVIDILHEIATLLVRLLSSRVPPRTLRVG